MVVRGLGDRRPQPEPFRHGAEACEEGQRRGESAVIGEVVLGQPDRIEAEAIGGERLRLDLAVQLRDILARRDVAVVEERETHRIPFRLAPVRYYRHASPEKYRA